MVLFDDNLDNFRANQLPGATRKQRFQQYQQLYSARNVQFAAGGRVKDNQDNYTPAAKTIKTILLSTIETIVFQQ